MEQTPPPSEPALTEEAISFLLKEYDVLKDLYLQSEAAAQSLFNFYLTILSAIIGALILVFQTGTTYTSGIVIGLLTFSIIVGIAYQAGIIDKYAESIRYTKAIGEIKGYLAKHLPMAAPPLYELPFKTATSIKQTKSKAELLEERIWWFFPVGTHQVFIAVTNSVCMSALLWSLLLIVQTATPLRLWESGIASLVVFWCSFIANNSYAKIKLRQEGVRYRLSVLASTEQHSKT